MSTASGTKWKKNQRRFVYKRDKGLCQICGRAVTFEQMTLDHIKPKSKGGGNTRDNLRCACEACNNRRGNLDPPWLAKAKWAQSKRRRLRAAVVELTTDQRIALQKQQEEAPHGIR